ncbi:MAG: hypothetical protein AVDCRST_MAG88-4454 [uncultured Thermomicrobiales bacterium]|uniref:Extradiol ring-cleavage dioxygenase class III enzyme subunit B domain-containing protein n=1 Tax=uncultured Thermomicrobiales bacterium TaxID=1645740 RepID=A0A6J4VTS9_9BACT|nr:MAG: hypothetical protein AVDCRST_MAG88-4454 [uncultured Thermomicrobiales bacterium]
MENVVFACIAPHGWLLIPLVSGPDGEKARASRAALEEMGRRMEAARPETVVIIEPHGLLIDNTISILDSSRVDGRTGGPTELGATAHGYSMTFDVDRDLNAAIAAAAGAAGGPVARARNFLDFGIFSPPKLVVASVGPGVPRPHYVGFGRAVRAAAAECGRRIAFIASADLGHRHAPGGPYGFDPSAAECDVAVVEAVRADALDRLLGYDAGWVGRAHTEAVEPLLSLHGVVEGTGLRPQVMLYEVPTYFGMLCAAYGPSPPNS